MSYKYSSPTDKIVLGRDFNFYTKIDVTVGSFQAAYDAIITFPTQTVMLLNEDTGSDIVEYSFNGNTLHGELNPALITKSMTFDNRVISKIWFRVKSGSTGPITVRIDAWATR